MTLPEIFVQLPDATQLALERALEGWPVPENPTSDQVLAAGRNIAALLKQSAPQEVHHLLDQLPQAVVESLF